MYIADFHIHSQYSRATSKNMNVDDLAQWAKLKGINLLGSGDFSHYRWLHELRQKLVPSDRIGIYRCSGIDFLLTTEVCAIFDRNGRAKKIHLMIFLSSLEAADELNRTMERFGDLNIDGRPILHVEARDLVQSVLNVDRYGFIVPAHIWTPHFSVFGANSGFNSLEECFGDMTGEIFALETGLSSDPEMNWQCSSLDNCALISNSDAHSPNKIGREANVFDAPFDMPGLIDILKQRDPAKFLYTVEYFPEEGKYHYDGHRNCRVSMPPEEAVERKNVCPGCGRPMTIGVLHRVRELADRRLGDRPPGRIDFRKLVPLDQIIGCVLGKEPDTVTVQNAYLDVVRKFGTEFDVLLRASEAELHAQLEPSLAAAIAQVREGRVKVQPGYDGEFGHVEIALDAASVHDQPALF